MCVVQNLYVKKNNGSPFKYMMKGGRSILDLDLQN